MGLNEEIELVTDWIDVSRLNMNAGKMVFCSSEAAWEMNFEHVYNVAVNTLVTMLSDLHERCGNTAANIPATFISRYV